MGRELEGKIALVTGATSGIGRATAVRFAEAGASLCAVGRSREALAEVAA
ncbi:MAG TPA: SDR family NAD(P)-dependent oxidoreductase, partial [Pyrinomonadaceae bacterium]